MAIKIHLRGRVPILEPNGKIVGPAVSELRDKLALWMDESSTSCLLIDLGHVHKIDSSGLGMLVNVYVIAARKGIRIGLINVGRHIGNLLILSRLINVFEHFDTEEAAVWTFTNYLEAEAYLNP